VGAAAQQYVENTRRGPSIAFYIELSASRELNLERGMVISAGNFQFGYNLAGEEEGEA
jgi:hypothetical protein